MHALVVGPGALGGLVASTLHRGRNPQQRLTLLDYNQERSQLIKNRGLIFHHGTKQDIIEIPVSYNPHEVEAADVVFLCVKSYDVAKTLGFCSSLLTLESLIIFLQNGISHIKFQDELGEAVAAFGTTTEGATSIASGEVRHAGSGQTLLGFLQQSSSPYQELLSKASAWLCKGGMHTELSNSILHKIWAKLFINVGINALTVIYNCKNGELLKIAEAMKYMKGAIDEAVAVAHFENIQVSNPLQKTLSVCEATRDNISSMLQDVRRGRQTEIQAINGAIVELAEKHGIPTPINSYLITKVNEIQSLNAH